MAKQGEERKLFRFCHEALNLSCEWEDCTVVKDDIEYFISHLLKEHLINLTGDDLHCHWKDCEGFTENLPELRRHILLHAFHAKIKCHGRNLQARKNIASCALSFQSRNIIPELPDPLVCYWENCLEEFECPEHFYRHADFHAEKNTSICLWMDCNRNFADCYKLREHLRSHTQEKLIACPTCGGMFASRTKFFDHIQRQLPVVDDDTDCIFICEYCSRKMNSERLLRDHMRLHVNHYKCPYCDMTCPTPSGIQVHVQYRHSENKPHACQYCDFKCKSENDLRKHLETHSLVTPYKCPVEGCSYSTRSQTCYSVHYTKTHEKKDPRKYACHLCDKMFARGNYLTKHLLRHHKFCWPSGHCRFRYRLHADGYFRLQTVRYESLELSQTMMSNDNCENIDDPSGLLNSSSSIDQEHPLLYDDQPEPGKSTQTVIHETNADIPTNSLLLCLNNKNTIEFPNETSINNSFLQNSKCSEQEPVLIQIVDSVDKAVTNSNGASVIIMNNLNQDTGSPHPTSVQVLTKDSDGRMVLETAELISEYNPLLS